MKFILLSTVFIVCGCRLFIQALILFAILGISVIIIYFSAVCIPPVAAKFFVICITVVIDLVILQ